VFAPCNAAAIWQLPFSTSHEIDLGRYAEAHIEFVLAALRPSA
jgi:hypothetical protein